MTDTMNNWLLGALVIGAGAYYILKKEQRIEILRKRGVDMAEKVTIEHFKTVLDKNPGTSLDSAILSFENAKVKELEAFAKTKGRTKESYYKAYLKYFEQARKSLINEQKNIERRLRRPNRERFRGKGGWVWQES